MDWKDKFEKEFGYMDTDDGTGARYWKMDECIKSYELIEFIQLTIEEEVKKERERLINKMNHTFITTDVYIMEKVMKVLRSV